MEISRLLLASGLFLATIGSGLRGANIVLDGGFETPDVSASSYIAAYFAGANIGSWHVGYTEYGTDVIHTNYTGGGVLWADPVEGSQFLYLGNSVSSGQISQQVHLDAGHSYNLSFWLAGFNSYTYGLGAKVSTDLTRSFDSVSVLGGPATFSFFHGTGFLQQNIAFNVVAGGDYVLSFTAHTGWAANLDDVRLVDTTAGGAGVPEAGSTLVLLTGALAGCWAARARRG